MMSAVQKTRRTHTKSRGGCKECKRRKLKCNEGKPICAGCRKREIQCEYPTNDPHNPSRHPAIPNLMTTPDSFDVQTPRSVSERGTGNFDMEDMSIWHHFIKSTAATISKPWGEEVPQLALKCDYLLHGILAIGALHLAYLLPDQREKFTHIAIHHQDLVFPKMNAAMANITPENGSEIFGASNLVIIFNFASSKVPDYPHHASADEGASNWIMCLRGCASIAYTAQAHVEAGPLGFMLVQGRELMEALASGLNPLLEDDESIKQISDTVLTLPSIADTTTAEEMKAYYDAIERLRCMFAASTRELQPVMKKSLAALWPCTISDIFIRMVSDKRPPALIIMAHYCVLVSRIKDCWYMEHRALHLLQGIEKDLGQEWRPWISRPQRLIMGRL